MHMKPEYTPYIKESSDGSFCICVIFREDYTIHEIQFIYYGILTKYITYSYFFKELDCITYGKIYTDNKNEIAYTEYCEYENMIEFVFLDKDRKKHAVYFPAEITYTKKGNIDMLEWYKNGESHSTKYTTRLYYNINYNTLDSALWYKNGQLHRDSGPAIIDYFIDETPRQESWYLEGKQHREDGPAVINYYKGGNVRYITYYENDILSPKYKYPCISYYKNKKIKFVSMCAEYEDGLDYYHDIHYPVKIIYKGDKQIKLYGINGYEYLSYTDFIKYRYQYILLHS